MRFPAFRRLALALLLLTGLTIVVAPQTLRPTPAHANTLTTSTICGVVTGYLEATHYAPGYIVIGGTNYVIATDGTMTNGSLIISGASICVQVVYSVSGAIISGTVTGTVPQQAVQICGTMTAFLPATPGNLGYIVINGTTYPIALGINMTGVNLIATGSYVCLQATLNSFGQIVVGSVIGAVQGAAAGGPFSVCGTVSGFIAATYTAPGSITINGQNFGIAPGVLVANQLAIGVGNSICLVGTLNSQLQIISATVSQSVTYNVIACGTISGYTPATPSTPGFITINGQTYTIAPGVVIGGSSLIANNAVLCLNGTTDAAGRVTAATVTQNTTGPAAQTTSICGVVTDYQAPAGGAAGLLSIGGKTYVVTAGATITGAGLLTSGTNVCLAATIDTAGNITSATVSFNGTLSVNVCGAVTAYTAATSVTAGGITIAGITFPIAAGVTLGGVGVSAQPGFLALSFTLNGQGLISGGTASAGTCTSATISGPIAAYVPPTASTVGSITIGTATYPVAPGTVLTIGNSTPLAATPWRPGRVQHAF